MKIIAQAILDFVRRGPSEKLGVVEEIQEMPLLWITPRTGREIREVTVDKFSGFMVGRWLWQGITGSKVKSG